VKFEGILWQQGEADAGAHDSATQYASEIDALMAALRANITGAGATTPFLLGQMVPDWDSVNDTGTGGGVNAAIVDTPYRQAYTAVALTPGWGLSDPVNAPPIHYSAPAQRLLGQRYVDALLLAQANVPSSVPIAPPSAPRLVQSGTSLVVIVPRPAGRVTDYTVQYRLVGAGSWTTFTKSRSIDAGAITPTLPGFPYAGRTWGGQIITGLTLGSSYEVQVLSVNEQGTSGPSPIATATLKTLPAQVTGLATGTATPATMPLTWTAVAGATAYQVEYKASASGSWLTGPLVQTNAATVTLLASGTSYDFRVSAVNEAGTGTASSTVTTSTVTPTPLVDAVGVSAWRAYGLRRMASTYSGAIITVRRSSDNTTQDIGFTAGGDLDQAALLTFVGAGNGFVSKWWDQSGNARHLTQSTQANQPQIVSSGAVITHGGQPAMSFNGTSQQFSDTSPGFFAAGAGSAIAVASTTIPATITGHLFSEYGASGGPRYEPFLLNPTGSSFGATIRNDAATSLLNALSGSANLTNNGCTCMSLVDTGTNLSQWRNGVVNANALAYSRTGVFTLTTFAIGQYLAAQFWVGKMSEIAFWTSALTTGQRQQGEGNAANYFTLT
jgi:hypothetical protein